MIPPLVNVDWGRRMVAEENSERSVDMFKEVRDVVAADDVKGGSK